MTRTRWEYEFNGRPGYDRRLLLNGEFGWEMVLGGNTRKHYMQKHETKQRDEGIVAQTVRWFRPEAPLTRARVMFVLHFTGNDVDANDLDNLHGLVKGALDGLVKGGVLRGDSKKYVKQLTVDVVPCVEGERDFYHITVEDLG